MKTDLCERFGIDVPIFAFSHCRDVVVAVSKAGGFGVLGAGTYTPEKLREELDWIDAHIGDKPYGIDIVLPMKISGLPDIADVDELTQTLLDKIPQEYMDFAKNLLKSHGVPEWDPNDPIKLIGWTEATTRPLFEEALSRDKASLIVSALGTPPKEMVDRAHACGKLVGALTGKPKHVESHKAAGVDIIIANGAEGGGHVGEIGSIVLWPQLVDAAAPLPVLAAGGIGNGRQILAALATGAQGVWTGSMWLTVEEAQAEPAQKQSLLAASSDDTVVTRSWTGKRARVLNNRWNKAWEAKDGLTPLGLPLQGLVTADAWRRTEKYAGVADTQDVALNIAGQVIGQINEIETVRQVFARLFEEYIESSERLSNINKDLIE
jgi:NAD(P)H-dependent flavin oxidoreductase YrpB (nitropropane dioxygenase family)